MTKKSFCFLGFAILAVVIFNTKIQSAFASQSPTPRITEVVVTSQGNNKKSIKAHFQISPVKNGEIIKVRYNLKTRKFNDVNYKPPKSAKKLKMVNSACSLKGSAVDISNIPDNFLSGKRFIYEVRVQIKQPKKSWSKWSNTFSF